MAETPDIDTLIEQCRTGDQDARYQAILALGRAGIHRAVDVILPSLEDNDPMVRYAAIGALSEIATERSDEVGAAIEPLLEDPDSLVRSEAAEALGVLRHTPASPALEQVLLEDPDATARASAAEALGALGDRSALASLLIAFGDDDGPVRSYVAWAIGMIGDPAGLQPLRHQLQTETWPNARTSLLVAAIQLGDEPAFDDLLALADSGSEEAEYEFHAAMSDLLTDEAPSIVLARSDELSKRLRAIDAPDLQARLDGLKRRL